jgi:hypothetical protein
MCKIGSDEEQCLTRKQRMDPDPEDFRSFKHRTPMKSKMDI